MTVRNLDALLKPRKVVLLGEAKSAGQQQLLRNVGETMAREQRWLLGATARGWQSVASLQALPPVDLAIGFDGRMLRPDTITQLAARECRALIWATDVPVDAARLAAARAAGIRILGARSPGLANLRGGINASAFQIAAKPGRLVLIAPIPARLQPPRWIGRRVAASAFPGSPSLALRPMSMSPTCSTMPRSIPRPKPSSCSSRVSAAAASSCPRRERWRVRSQSRFFRPAPPTSPATARTRCARPHSGAPA